MITQKINNWVGGEEQFPSSGSWIPKFNPHDGGLLSEVANSTAADVESAVAAAAAAFPMWSEIPAVRRGQILSAMVATMKDAATELARCVAIETGKPPGDAAGEVAASILQGEYFAGEGMRLYARSLTSAVPFKYSHSVRQPRGVAALIVPANTPIANIAWKVFPALICGNTVVLKAAEDAPSTARLFAEIAARAGLPDGVLNVVQGLGSTAGDALVNAEAISLISFTGSTSVGRRIAEIAGRRLIRVSLELGGKNPFVVCDDADLEKAVHWAALSAFSNAGQRCAAGSKALVQRAVYDRFREMLVSRARSLRLGVTDGCSLGPLINRRQQESVLRAVDGAVAGGGKVHCGGQAPDEPGLCNGYYVQPTVIDGLTDAAELSRREIFGPVVALYPVDDLQEALQIANAGEYGLTCAIHTRSVDRAMWFAQRVRAGIANVNFGTFGSEPHMPFGGFGHSGNGSREPGVEALDVYSELKNISVLVRSETV